MSTNGKGSKSRVRDVESYRKNFDAINWRKVKRIKNPKLPWFFRGLVLRGRFPL